MIQEENESIAKIIGDDIENLQSLVARVVCMESPTYGHSSNLARALGALREAVECLS